MRRGANAGGGFWEFWIDSGRAVVSWYGGGGLGKRTRDGLSAELPRVERTAKVCNAVLQMR